MSTNAELAALLSRVALRDRAAFEQVYRATSAHLLAVAFRILNQRERAEEVLQEAFMNVWNSAGSFNASVATPMTWLINVVRNKAIDAHRSGRAERASTVELDDAISDTLAEDALGPVQLLERNFARLKIDACMAELSASQRQALALAYYSGLVHTEIAASLGAPLGTAKAWVRRGLDRLRGCLDNAGIRSA